MIFRQLFDSVSGTYTYLLASRSGGEALIIDPVLDKVERYIQLMNELDLKLVKAIDTHLHADHITGLGALRDRTQCVTVMGEQTKADVVSMRVRTARRLGIEGLDLDVIYTPGHTDDSYCFTLPDRVFTGDTLLIRGTGRTDFQNGDARAQYESIFNRLLKLPDDTLVYPGARLQRRYGQHHRRGEGVQSAASGEIGRRIRAAMNNLHLPNPKMMDVAVPANMRVGLAQDEIAKRGWAVSGEELAKLIASPDVALVDLREVREIDKNGAVENAIRVPFRAVAEAVKPGGALYAIGGTKQLVFLCAYGERSAMAVQAAQEAGFKAARHLNGGLSNWRK